MMGSVLFNVNVRLSEDQDHLHTMNHARPKVLLVNAEFLPVFPTTSGPAGIGGTRHPAQRRRAPQDAAALGMAGEYETLLAASPAQFDFPDFDEHTAPPPFTPPAPPACPKGCFHHRQLVLYTLSAALGWPATPSMAACTREDVACRLRRCSVLHAWGVPYIATLLGIKAGLPGRYLPESLLNLIAQEKSGFSQCVPTICTCCSPTRAPGMLI